MDSHHLRQVSSPTTSHEAALLLHASREGPAPTARTTKTDMDSYRQVDDRLEKGGSGYYAASSSRDPPSGYNRAQDQSFYDEPPAKKARRPSDQPEAAASSSFTSEAEPVRTGKRASQACLRCRKQKLRCLGGWPCDRCTKGRYECDFGAANLPPGPRPGQAQQIAAATAAQEANARLQQLESSVASLLAGLAGQQDGGHVPGSTLNQLLQQAGLDRHAFSGSQGGRSDSFAGTSTGLRDRSQGMLSLSEERHAGDSVLPGWQTNLPPPTHSRPIIAPRLTSDGADTRPTSHDPHVRFASSPHAAYSAPSLTSPSNAASSGISPGSALSGDGLHGRRGGKQGKGQKAEERLAAATEGEFEPPFKSLVYQPAVWDNKEQSNRSSPQPSGLISRDESNGGTAKDKEDPINTGLLDMHVAQILFTFFVDNCHPFLPVVNVGLPDAFSTIRQSSFLTSAILATAARFYPRYCAKDPMAGPALPGGTPMQLAEMAEAHLGRTLLRKQHALSDVQAILIMAAWGLQSGGRGPDAWIATGHAARIARRLGVHQALAKASDRARSNGVVKDREIAETLTDDAARLERFLPQWRTWLGWFTLDGLLSLGFGRPQSSQFETVDEQGFLQLRLSQTQAAAFPHPGSPTSRALHGDVYIAGQVQLAQIGRDIVAWSAMLADPERALKADPRRADVVRDKELSVKSMLGDLNKRLDDWSKLWVWNGSPYTLYLGPSARIARLHAEHIRLCLNSFALQADPEADEQVAACLKKGLMAAQSTIQTHFDSSQTDLALSFATDYLTITLAQAAVFLIRLARSLPAVQTVLALDGSVVVHYLKMAVEVLENADLSETRLSTFLGRTIRDIARAAGIQGLGMTPAPASSASISSSGRPLGGGDESAADFAPHAVPMAFDQDLSAFDLDPFLGFENHLNIESLLGLPGDGVSSGNQLGDGSNGGFTFSTDQSWATMPSSNLMGEFEFGIGGNTGGGWMVFDNGPIDPVIGTYGQNGDQQ